ncbi:polyhomeotic-like protein 2 isoform X2 [Argonauta hians]
MSDTRPGSESGAVTVSGATTSVRTSIPQVQVIHQPVHSPPYMPSFPYNQQQLMLQNAAVQGVYLAAAMQAGAMNQQLNIAAMQGRPPSASPKSPSVLSPSPTAGVTCVASAQPSASSSTAPSSCANGKLANNGSKALVSQAGTSQGQATPHIGGKPVFSTQAVPSLLVGQIGVLPGQGPSANQAFVSQSKNQSACHTVVSQPQLINSQSPLRMNSQSQLVTSGGQIFASQPMLTNPAMLQAMASLQQGIPLAHQPLLTQSPTILAGQPLYIRTATPLQQQPSMVAAATATPTAMQPVNSLKTAKLIDMTTGLQAKTVGLPTKPTNPANKGLSAILPSTSKGSNTAKIHPTNISMQATTAAPKLNIPTITTKQTTKVRTKKGNPSSTASQTKPTMPTSLSKPTTPTSQTNGTTINLPKSQSDSEVETGRKTIAMIENPPEKKTVTEATSKQPAPEQKQEKRPQAETPPHPPTTTTTTQETRQVEPMEVVSAKPQNAASTLLDNSVVVEKQKAIVKPHILTHVIEGFIIHEGPEPFPVQRSSLLTEYIPSKTNSNNNNNNNNVEKESEQEETNGSSHDQDVPMAEDTEGRDGDGEGIVDPPSVEKRISPSSAPKYVKRRKPTLKVRKTWRPNRVGRMPYNIPQRPFPRLRTTIANSTRRDGVRDRLPAEEHSSSHSSHESSSSPTSPAQPTDYDAGMDSSTSNPAKWTVQKVFDFIHSMPGCTSYAEEFRSQEIDGQALLLLKEDHLMTAMNMKLGPALKICARINSLKDSF